MRGGVQGCHSAVTLGFRESSVVGSLNLIHTYVCIYIYTYVYIHMYIQTHARHVLALSVWFRVQGLGFGFEAW